MTYLMLIVALNALAQSDSMRIKEYYEQHTIYWNGSKKYFIGERSFPIRKLGKELAFSKDASFEWQLYRKARRKSQLLVIAAEVSLVGAIVPDQPGPGLLLVATGGVCAVQAARQSMRSVAHLQRAIWLANRDILLR